MKTTARLASVIALVAALAVPAASDARPIKTTPGSSGVGCNYRDADGYNIPIDHGQQVIVDGKIVTCVNGTVVVTSGPVVMARSL